MITTLMRRVRDLLTLALLGLLLPAGANAAGLTITPATVPADYAEKITLNVSGLRAGQTVMVETYLDYGGDGTINFGDPMIQCFMLTDGEAAAIGGVRNVNVPGDNDGNADGSIHASFRIQAFPEIAKGIANYLYKVSPVTGSFEAVAAIFEITQLPDTATTGKVTGTVKSGGSPLAFAYVFLITPNAGGPIVGALADAGGKFTLTSEAGTYMLGAVKNGFLFDFVTAPLAQIIAHGTVTRDLSLTAANATISGRLTDLESGAGIPGVQMTAESGDPGMLGLAFSDADGNFTIPVSTAPQWRVDASYRSAALLGYLALSESYQVETGGGSVADAAIRWPKATALIYGTLKDDQNKNLAGVVVQANNDEHEGFGLTDGTGNYVIGVRAGGWGVGPSSDDLLLLGYYAEGAYVSLDANEALQQNLAAQRFTAHLSGRVTDDQGQPVGSICINAFPGHGDGVDGTTDANGNFSLPVYTGNWYLGVCSEDAQQRDLVRSIRPFDVVGDVTNIQYKVRHATAHITGRITDAVSHAPIVGVAVNASTMVESVAYDSWQETNADGQYSLGVFDGDWYVNLDCDDLQSRGYVCPTSKVVGPGGVANFAVPLAGGPCLGDCDRNHVMSPGELVTLVSIALGPGDITPCNGTPGEPVTVDQIVGVWNGCPG